MLQALCMVFDEGYFHLRRGLPRWERIGHPIDTLSVLVCMGFILFIPFSKTALIAYIVLASFSSILVTKDEFVHKEHCPASENWLHAVLFTLHPITLTCAGFIWPVVQGVEVAPWITSWLDNTAALLFFLKAQFGAMALFLVYQIIYWNFIWKEQSAFFRISTFVRPSEAQPNRSVSGLNEEGIATLCPTKKIDLAKPQPTERSGNAENGRAINNAFYDDLAEGWYTASNHPIALLRAENAVRIPWILSEIGEAKTVLDIGCGAGILTNTFAQKGHRVSGIDLSAPSIEVARGRDTTRQVDYRVASAYELPYPDQTFDVVCAMDVLEHVEEPLRLIQEASRVLKPGGLFFFHTFNRNWLSYLLIIKGVDWAVPNAPKNMHVYPLFIKPRELREMALSQGLEVVQMRGFVPQLFSRALVELVFKRKISSLFPFRFCKSLATGYCGSARKIVAK